MKLSSLTTKANPVGADLLTWLDSEDWDINTQNKNFSLTAIALYTVINSVIDLSVTTVTWTTAEFNAALSDWDFATWGWVISWTSSWTNTWDQTSIVWITWTKAEFDTACTDWDFAYQSDIPDNTDFVDLTTTQNVWGVKTFTDWVVWDVNWVSLSTAWVSTDFLNATGGYSAPAWGGSGFNLKYPHWLDNLMTPVNWLVDSGIPYTVPVWKVLYVNSISWATNTIPRFTIDWLALSDATYNPSSDTFLQLTQPVLAEAWAVLATTTTTNGYFSWFLVPENANITVFNQNTNYTVPASKKLVILQFFTASDTWLSTTMNGVTTTILRGIIWDSWTDISMNMTFQPIILNAWDSFTISGTNVVHGYVLPDDFSI